MSGESDVGEVGDVSDDEREIRRAVDDQRARTTAQIAALEASLASIVDGTEMANTDDEHDPEGSTIAYERAQVIALLRLARRELDDLDATTARLTDGSILVCESCGGAIPVERLLALPDARTCVGCAGGATGLR